MSRGLCVAVRKKLMVPIERSYVEIDADVTRLAGRRSDLGNPEVLVPSLEFAS